MNQEQPRTIADSVRTAPVPAAPRHGLPMVHLHLPEPRQLKLPITVKSLAMLVAGWFVLLVILNGLVGFYAGKPKLSQANAASSSDIIAKLSPDDERRANIDSLHVHLEKYYASFANYPSRSQLNSIEFRKADPAFKNVNRRTFIDPATNSALLADTPDTQAYFYIPTPVGCDSSQVMCSGYTVGTTLSTGERYTHKNLN